MGSLIAIIQKFVKGAQLTAATYTYGPYNAEDLNGAQWFLKYTNGVNTTVNCRFSNYEAHGRDYPGTAAELWADANAYDEVEQLAVGDNSGEGFFDPTTEADRPFKSFEVDLIVAATAANVHFSLGRHGAG